MVVQQPTLLNGSILGLLQGTASYAITASYALNASPNKEVFMWYGRVPPLDITKEIFLNNQIDTELPFNDNKIYKLTTQAIAKKTNGDIWASSLLDSIFYYLNPVSGSNPGNLAKDNSAITFNNLNSGSSYITLASSPYSGSNKKILFSPISNDVNFSLDIYIFLSVEEEISLNNLPSTI